jgi:hypothetical protein
MGSKKVTGGGWAVAPVVLAGLLGAAGAVAACGGSEGGGAKMATGAHAKGLDHESCPESGNKVEGLDTNGDGKEDIRRVSDKGGHELCRVADLNHDGKPDLYEYFDSSGAVRRREYCYDDTGVVNAVEYYEGGKLVRREYDTSGQHYIDTWDWFDPNAAPDPKTGRPAHPVRRERDTTGDGVVDQWWAWDGNNVTIAVDHTGDGKPDPDTAVTLGPDNSVVTPAAPSAAPASSAASAASAPAAASDAGAAAPAPTTAAPPPASASAGDGGKP